ncbi:MAG: sigma-70 family RNA polymerase sigma factor [Flavitalea sp.]
MKSDPQESGLLKGLAENDRQAVEMIYSRHFGMIQSLVINNNGSSDDARDIFQEAMIVLYEKSKNEEFELTCQLKTYLYSVCKRLWLKKLSQYHRLIPDLNGVDEMVPVEDDIEAHDQKNAEYLLMERALSGLGEPCKSLLEAFYLQKKNMAEIASGFGYTNPDNAKNQKYKCLIRLRKLFFTEYKISPFDE